MLSTSLIAHSWLDRISVQSKDDLSILLLVVCGLFALTGYAWVYFLKPRNGKIQSLPLPPGPTGLPLVGSLPFLDPELHTYFQGLAKTYGPVLKLRLGNKLAVVVTSPGAAKEVLKDHDVTFANRDVPAAGRVATYGGVDIVWTPYGPEWRMLRKVCALKMLSNATLDSVYGLRKKEVRETIRYCHARVGSPVNIGEQMFLTMLNIITNMMWGGTVQGDERASLGSEFRQVVSEMTALLGTPNVSDFFTGLARFDLQGVERKTKVLVTRFDGIFETMIRKRLKIEETGDADVDGGERSNDFLQFLLKVKDEADAKTPLTMTGLKALLMDMVVGGTDTSSNTIEFAMAEIMNKPHILKLIQEELDAVIGTDNIVEESHIHKLPYLHAVMKESLRLHPSLPLLVPHCPSEDSAVGGFRVPKGSRVFINVWAIHRDPMIWENPTEFDPDRFLNGKWDYSGNDFGYFPFGSGRRICAGISMAERMVLYSLAMLLHSFDWELPAGEKLDLSEQFGIVLKKKVPLVAIPRPRLSNAALYE